MSALDPLVARLPLDRSSTVAFSFAALHSTHVIGALVPTARGLVALSFTSATLSAGTSFRSTWAD
jgi:hypothetical protein